MIIVLKCKNRNVWRGNMKVAIGQDSHRIDYDNTNKKLILGRNRI